MDVAVTGSSGLIGSALCDALVADGHRAIRIVRRPAGADEAAVQWDPAAGTIEAHKLEGLDAVVHLAGEGIGDKRWSDEQKRRIMDSRVQGTALLTETLAGLTTPPPVLVSGSAMGIYGDGGNRELTEQSPPGDIFLSEVCLAWEAAAQPAVDAGIRVPFIRTGIVLSAAGGALKRLLPLFKLGLGGRFGSGEQWMSWISLHDEIAAIRWLIEHDVAGPVNLTAPNPVTNAELTRQLAAALHRPAFLPVPAFGPKLLYGSDLVDQLLLLSQRVLPAVLTEHGFEFEHPELPAALRAVL